MVDLAAAVKEIKSWKVPFAAANNQQHQQSSGSGNKAGTRESRNSRNKLEKQICEQGEEI